MKTKRILSIILIILASSIVCADPPNWEQIQGTQYSMVLMAQITFDSELFEGVGNNMAGAFGPGGEQNCRSIGVWLEPNPPYWDGYWYFTIVGNIEGEDISFKIYDSETEAIYGCYETILFEDNATIGSAHDPVIITAGISAPENVQIEITGNDVTLSWLPSLDASFYSVYSSNNPNYEFPEEWNLLFNNITDTFITFSIDENETMFFRITASN